MNRLAISLLGPFRVTLDGKPVTQFEADTARALLAYLVAHAGTPQRRETLAGLLWPEQPESLALGNLRQALKRLRSAIRDRDADPPFLHVTRKSIQFNPDSDYWLDVAAFSDAIAASQEHRHRRLEACRSCMRRLAEAVEVYRGDFLAGFSLPSVPFEEWLVVQRERLHRQSLEALGYLAAYHERRREWERAGGYARRQVELEPWRESAHQGLMRALALSGERTAALAQYEVCCRTLAEELGVEPEEETTALYEHIREGSELEALSPVPPCNLPTFLTPFVRREAMLAEIEVCLADPDCRLLSLVGPGGSGKTRLAVEAGAAQVAAFDHGVFFVRLAPLGSVEAIVPTVAQALGFSFYAGAEGGAKVEPRQQLLDYVRQKSMLLIMDNFEHLLDGVDLVTDVLKTAPDVSVLTTSRARLNVQGEQLFPVAGMDVPDEEMLEEATQYSAVKLFLTSARRAQPGFELTAENITDVIRICHLVQGMPLGILLAAAWIQMLSPAEITAQIGQSLGFLETDLRDVPARQRSMRAVFDHSWNLLTERSRSVMQALSVFRGGFIWEAAQEITDTSLRELMALVNKSLLHRTPIGRYEMHVLLRQYAAEKLDQVPIEGEAAHDRHSAFYATALQGWGEDLKGPRQQTALVEMDVEIENARVAWDWAVEQGQVERLDQAMEGLCLFYSWRVRYQEGEVACRMAAVELAAIASGDGPVLSAFEGLRVWAKTLAWQSVFSRAIGRTELASQLLQQSLTLLERPELADQDTRSEKAFVLRRMGDLAFGSDREEAQRLYEQSLALYQALGDRWGTANALHDLGFLAENSGAYDEAKQIYEESLAIRRALNDQRGIADSLMMLGVTTLFQGRLEEGERLAREGNAIRQEMGDRASTADGLSILGATLVFLGKYTEAHSLLEESLAAYNDLGSRYGLAHSNSYQGIAKVHLGRYEGACVQGQMSLALNQDIGNQREAGYSLLVLGSVALAGEAYAEAQRLLQESVAVYQEIGQRDALGLALAVLGYVERGLDQLPQAGQHLYEALQTVTAIRAFRPLMHTLPAIALLLADQGENERAVELYALASRHLVVANSRWFEDVAGKHIAAVAATLPPDVVAAAQQRGRARDLWATAAELLVELEGEQTPQPLVRERVDEPVGLEDRVVSIDRPTAAVGVIADRFEISDPEKDLIGGGEMGHVYRGTDTQTGQAVAIKALKPEILASHPDIVARFIREGEALRQLNHPNIVQMVDAVEEDGQHYIIMEYVAGGSLRDLLEAGEPLPITRILEIALELADALSRAHHLGVIHRDLKPANVLLAGDGTPRLTDFGHALVAASPRLTRTGALMGSVGYLSPEACNGETLDNRADIWALGVMLYEMLSGELPFVGDSLIAAITAILTQPVSDLAQLRPDVPDALADLIYRMLEKDRDKRVPSARQVGAELEAILRMVGDQ